MLSQSPALQQARELSAGTISHLICRTRYEAIDRAREEFTAFIGRMDAVAGRPFFPTWQDAWADFRNTDKAYEVMLAP